MSLSRPSPIAGLRERAPSSRPASERRIAIPQARAAFAALVLASVLSCGFVVVRRVYADQVAYPFYFWNLFLAWIPLIAAVIVYSLLAQRHRNRLVAIGPAVVWFLFFPNAPYVMTDIVHLREHRPVPYWYDMIMVMSFALTGLFLGYLSLYLMQEVVRARLGRAWSWAFALVMLGLSAFGIYLGRFVRWNSWDAFLDPVDMVVGAARIANPFRDPEPLAFSAAFFAFSMVCYLIVCSFTHLHAWVERAPVRPEGEKRIAGEPDLE